MSEIIDGDLRTRRVNFLNHITEVYDMQKTVMRQNFPVQRLCLKVKSFFDESDGKTVYSIDGLPVIVDPEVCSQAFMWLVFLNDQGEKGKLIISI